MLSGAGDDGGACGRPAAPFELRPVSMARAAESASAPAAAAADHGTQQPGPAEQRLWDQQCAEHAAWVASGYDGGGGGGGGGGGAENDDPLWQLWLAGGEPDCMTGIFEGLEQAGRDRAEEGCWQGAWAPHAGGAAPAGAAF